MGGRERPPLFYHRPAREIPGQVTTARLTSPRTFIAGAQPVTWPSRPRVRIEDKKSADAEIGLFILLEANARARRPCHELIFLPREPLAVGHAGEQRRTDETPAPLIVKVGQRVGGEHFVHRLVLLAERREAVADGLEEVELGLDGGLVAEGAVAGDDAGLLVADREQLF